MGDLDGLRKRINSDKHIRDDEIEEFGYNQYDAKWVREIPKPPTCIYCNADWTPEMIEIMEVSGYCESCYSEDTVIDVFCSKCEKLVYRKAVY